PPVLHRLLERLHHGAVETPDLLGRQRVAHAIPAQPGAEEDLVAVDVADPGEELLVHQERLQLHVLRRDEPPEAVPRHRVLERIDPEVRQLRHLLLHTVELRHEHLAERAWVDEAQLTALRERDHDVGVLRHGLARALGPDELSGHAEMDHQDVAAIEPGEDVLATSFDPGDALADETVRELLAVVVPTDRAHAVGVDCLDALADDLAFEGAPNHLDLRQLRHRCPPVGTSRSRSSPAALRRATGRSRPRTDVAMRRARPPAPRASSIGPHPCPTARRATARWR